MSIRLKQGKSDILTGWLPLAWRSEAGAEELPFHLTVIQSIQTFDDVRAAMDNLRAGSAQIVSFGSTPATLITRFADMLTGTAYGLGGKTTLVGDAVYLFTPADVRVVLPPRDRF